MARIDRKARYNNSGILFLEYLKNEFSLKKVWHAWYTISYC
nr:MAG TPA: hypothetical protein [Caudoviricetes sp.]